MERFLYKDEMTPNERFEALSKGEEIDRIPCCPIIGEAATTLIGTTVRKLCHSSELMAEMEISLYKRFNHDSVGVGPDLFGIAEAMGTILEYPEHDIPYVEVPVLKDYKDLDKLIPVNPYKDGRLPMFLEALKRVKDEVGHEVGVGSSLGGPITTASAIVGTENLLRDMIRRPEEVHKLLKVVTESAFNYIDAIHALGIKPSIPEPIGSSTVISAKQFRIFVKPYLKMYVDKIIEKYGSAPTLHICGNTKPIWSDMADTGVKTISLDNIVDLEEAKNTVGDRVTLMGNVRPVDIMKYGTKEEIFLEVKDCIRKGFNNPKGFILSTGCQLPMGTSMDQLEYFMEAARLYGRWPINKQNLI